ncbi:MAG: DivIVA domain-containing protein [Clostridia bacterium]|nr:DivIVA domain-containing protein [Clostridia bacterium]
MAKFDINKKGYDIEQVDNFINKLSLKYEEKLSEQKDRVFSLKNELAVIEERLETYREKDKQISKALIYAVEKAEQIEGNASKLYDLEIKRLRLIYKQWEDIIAKISLEHISSELAEELAKFSSTITTVLDQNTKIGGNMIRKDLHKNSNNYIRNLLNRMDYAINEKPKQTPRPSVLNDMSIETEKENSRLLDVSGKLDKVKAKGSGSMADNYLNSDLDTQSSIFARTITRKNAPKKQESGFDLEEALNPKEDLDEIMKAFDFFLEDEETNAKKKKK